MNKNYLILSAIIAVASFLVGILSIIIKFAVVGMIGYISWRFLEDGMYWWKKD